MNQYYVYIMSSYRGALYIGVTSDLVRRTMEHRSGLIDGFTKKYKVDKLVYYEVTDDVGSAIAREKQLKGWLRRKKIELIESVNPSWIDLASPWTIDTATPPDPSARRVGLRVTWADHGPRPD